mmetsp:Transcript_44651/g.140015  ORF Transcript_44651/g.140015 Transcript_44651/m.140015 type:complete len:86 (+) Transcript_44651:334-591(+)
MNCHVDISLRLLGDLAAHLGEGRRRGCVVVLTVKLVHRGHNAWLKLEHEVLAKLKAMGVQDHRCYHLLSNRRHEKTIIGSFPAWG